MSPVDICQTTWPISHTVLFILLVYMGRAFWLDQFMQGQRKRERGRGKSYSYTIWTWWQLASELPVLLVKLNELQAIAQSHSQSSWLVQGCCFSCFLLTVHVLTFMSFCASVAINIFMSINCCPSLNFVLSLSPVSFYCTSYRNTTANVVSPPPIATDAPWDWPSPLSSRSLQCRSRVCLVYF